METSRYFGRMSVTSRSPINTRPALAVSRPERMRSAVVFPEPEAPSSTRNSPGAISRSNSSSTLTLPKYFRTLSKRTGTWRAASEIAMFIRSSLDRAKQDALGDIALQHDSHDDHRKDHDHDNGTHLPPENAPLARVLGGNHNRHGLGSSGREEDRKEILVPIENKRQQGGCSESRTGQGQHDV